MLNWNNQHWAGEQNNQRQNQIKRINQYLFNMDDEIGRGFSSVVYKGKDLLTGQTNAIKVIELKKKRNQIEMKLINNEIRALKLLDYPYVLKAKEVLQTSNNLYVVTQFYETSLEELVRKRGKFSDEEILHFIERMAQALCYLEQKNIVHRDIKPSNIFVKSNEFVLGDFGFCSFRNPYNMKPQSIHYNVGSPLYMSPQSCYASIYSLKSDVWSLGMCILQLIFGQKPFLYTKYQEMILILQTEKFIQSIKTTCLIRNILRGIFVTDPHTRIYPSQILRNIQNHRKSCILDSSPLKKAGPDKLCNQNIKTDRKISCEIPLKTNRTQNRKLQSQKVSAQAQNCKKFMNFNKTSEHISVSRSLQKILHRNQSLGAICNKQNIQAYCNPFIKIIKQLSQDCILEKSSSKIKLVKLLLQISPSFKNHSPILSQIEGLEVKDEYLKHILKNIWGKNWKQYDQYLLFLIQKCAKQAIEQYKKKMIAKDATFRIFQVLYEFYEDYKHKKHLLKRHKNQKPQDHYVPERPTFKSFEELQTYWSSQN